MLLRNTGEPGLKEVKKETGQQRPFVLKLRGREYSFTQALGERRVSQQDTGQGEGGGHDWKEVKLGVPVSHARSLRQAN